MYGRSSIWREIIVKSTQSCRFSNDKGISLGVAHYHCWLNRIERGKGQNGSILVGNGTEAMGATANKSILTAAIGKNHAVRRFARSSESTPEGPEEKAKSFLRMVGYEDEYVVNGVVDALKQSGMSGEALLAMVRSMAGRWEVGEDDGLEALVVSIQKNLAQTQGKELVQVWCVPPQVWSSNEGQEEEAPKTGMEKEKMMERAFLVEALEGTTLTDVAKFGDGPGASTLGEYIECACSGIMACSTCHVVIDPEWFQNSKIGPPCEDEQDMIDLAFSPRATSRLGCQIVLTKELNGVIIQLPRDANNLMDYVPF